MKKLIKQTNLTLRNSRTFMSTVHTTNLPSLNPWFIAGFVDGEGCFSFSISKSDKYKVGWYVRPSFQIELSVVDLPLIKSIKSFLGVGNIVISKKGSVNYSVRNLDDLINVIIPYFNKYNLITQKQVDFELFKQIIYLIKDKEHLSEEGLRKILSIKASMNHGLSPKLLEFFPNITPISRPKVKDQAIQDANWLAGFTAAEGYFKVRLYKSTAKLGESVELGMRITQHARDITLMKDLNKYIGCGVAVANSAQSVACFYVSKFSSIYNFVIPFYQKYPLLGAKKNLDFLDFCEVAELINKKAHLTPEGLYKIRQIREGMNSKRVYNS